MSDFTAATWNVFHGTDLDVLEPILRRLRRRGVSLFLIQEGQQDALGSLLAKYGLQSHQVGFECIVAYDLDVWDFEHVRAIALSPTTYHRKGGKAVPHLQSPLVRLRHKATGRKLKALSYHTPSAVQRGGRPNEKVAARLRVTEAAMSVLRRLTRQSKTALLFGGDDNFDERLGRWRELLRGFTGLRVVQAPSGTHGHGDRRIDDFRTRGLRALTASTTPGGGDHEVHVRSFDFN